MWYEINVYFAWIAAYYYLCTEWKLKILTIFVHCMEIVQSSDFITRPLWNCRTDKRHCINKVGFSCKLKLHRRVHQMKCKTLRRCDDNVNNPIVNKGMTVEFEATSAGTDVIQFRSRTMAGEIDHFWFESFSHCISQRSHRINHKVYFHLWPFAIIFLRRCHRILAGLLWELKSEQENHFSRFSFFCHLFCVSLLLVGNHV